MSYIEIELGGKLRQLSFNMICLEVYTKNINFEAPATSSIYATFFGGLHGYYTDKRLPIDFEWDDVVRWVKELNTNGKKDVIERVCSEWAKADEYKEWLKEFQDKVRTILEPGEKKDKKKVK